MDTPKVEQTIQLVTKSSEKVKSFKRRHQEILCKLFDNKQKASKEAEKKASKKAKKVHEENFSLIK